MGSVMPARRDFSGLSMPSGSEPRVLQPAGKMPIVRQVVTLPKTPASPA